MNKIPLVSICLPNLNNRRYLPERFNSIFNQTFQDWELIILDSYSDDGSWEYIKDFTDSEPRAKCFQVTRGMYPTWNKCIKLALGKYVYIATSDDNMALDCLEKMVAALEEHPECDLAHCLLRTFDENGVDQGDSWIKESLFAKSSSELLHRKHIRAAPHDGLLHLNGYFSVYISITEILIRKSLFEKIGYFQTEFGSIADYGWNMRASLVGSTIHVPDTWAGWRRHAAQSTAQVNPWSEEHQQKIRLMMDYAIEICRPHLPKRVVCGLESGWSHYFQQKSKFDEGMSIRKNSFQRLCFIATQLLLGSKIALEYIKWRFSRKNDWNRSESEVVREWLTSIGFDIPLKVLD